MKRTTKSRIKQKQKRKTKKRVSRRKSKQVYGGDINPKDYVLSKENYNFRNMFLKAFYKLYGFLGQNMTINDPLINKALLTFSNGFKGNQLVINTLIPVTSDFKPIDKNQPRTADNPLYAFVPCLTIIYENIKDTSIRKKITEYFIKNKGNINLKSYTKNITALSTAIKIGDKELIDYLLQNNAIPTDEQKEQLSYANSAEDIVKLVIPNTLPSESQYDRNVEPEFWKQLFKDGLLFDLRSKMQNMMLHDSSIPIENSQLSDTWSVCKINQSIIPTYYVPNKNEPYMSFGSMLFDLPDDFSHFNIVLCASLLVFGLISEKMRGQDYKCIFKGGKAIQLELTNTSDIYKTEDIDILVSPNSGIPYEEHKVKCLTGNIAYLLKWFLDMPESKFQISVLEPDLSNTKTNPYIYKLSYIKNKKRYDYRKRQEVSDFKQFSDIDFKEIPDGLKQYFDKTVDYTFDISELGEKVLFVCPNIGSLLDEKIYYYAKYLGFLVRLKNGEFITEEGYQNLNISECERLLDKFKRAILALNSGLQKQRFPGLNDLREKELASLNNRLKKLSIDDTNIVPSLYS